VSWAIWITGIPGSGKSVLARAAAAALAAAGEPVKVLELDEIRRTVTPAPRYTDAEREVVYRALVFMAAALVDAGVPVIVDATAHRRAWRDLARRTIPRFAEVQLDCPLEVARRREQARTGGHAPRNIYARAGRPGAAVPGVDVPYERALAPELVIDTAAEETAVSAERIVRLARSLRPPGVLARPRPEPARWVVWITGLPGSGKTTLAVGAARALAARGAPVRVLDAVGVRAFLLGGEPPGAPQDAEDLVHRALVCTARLLAEAGVGVIVDATSPRRAWRELARREIGRFAEVQLVCSRDVCWSRERAGRWGLGAAPAAAHGGPPDVVLDYEPALSPELTLYTDVQAPWISEAEVVRLLERLERAAAAEGGIATAS